MNQHRSDILKLLSYREEVKPSDVEGIREIVDSTGFFKPDEIQVAAELAQERLTKGIPSGYYFLFAEYEEKPIGYTCFGPIACTGASYDLFWIAVHYDYRGLGLGKELMRRSEEIISRLGGRRIYVETSSIEKYVPTRAFYLNCGYKIEAELEDFYYPGDAKVIFLKTV